MCIYMYACASMSKLRYWKKKRKEKKEWKGSQEPAAVRTAIGSFCFLSSSFPFQREQTLEAGTVSPHTAVTKATRSMDWYKRPPVLQRTAEAPAFNCWEKKKEEATTCETLELSGS